MKELSLSSSEWPAGRKAAIMHQSASVPWQELTPSRSLHIAVGDQGPPSAPVPPHLREPGSWPPPSPQFHPHPQSTQGLQAWVLGWMQGRAALRRGEGAQETLGW